MTQPPKTPDTPDDLPEVPHAHPDYEPPEPSSLPVPPAPPVPPVPPPPASASQPPPESDPTVGPPAGWPAPEPTPQVVPPLPPPITPVPPTPPVGGYAAPTPPPTPPPPLTPPGPPLGPGAGSGVYGKGANRMNLLGYLSIVFGVLGTGCCCCPWLNGAPLVGGIPAIVLGVMHLMRVSKGQASQRWLGWVGIALGVLALAGAICGFATDLDTRITDEYQRQFDGN